MSYLQAVLLGVIQGVAEFLPVSSSGHLYLAKYFLNMEDIPLIFDISLHLATLLAVFIVFREKISKLAAAAGRWCLRRSLSEDTPLLSMLFVIFFATLITGVLGIFIERLAIPLPFVAFGMLYTSVLLIVLSFLPQHTLWPAVWQIIFLGLFQAIAVFPGISRSGSTIFAAVLVGHPRNKAGEFSFILSIPIILAAFLFSLKDIDRLSLSTPLAPVLLSMLCAFVSGILSLRFLLRLISGAKLYYFSIYLIALASFVFMKI